MPRPMKHSDVDWIGDIPADWDIVQLKRIAEIQTGNTPSKTENDKYYSQESGYLWIKAEDLGSIKPIASTTEYLTEDGIKYGRLFPPNTVYVCCIASVGKVGFCNISASCNQQINGLIFNNAYWKYGFFLTVAQESEYIINASGNVMKIINADKQARLMCPLPPLDEQQRIANFLDNECASIDNVIDKTRASIVEYKKLKQSIITRAVTKGMRPARPMKDSGIEWLGDIPADWEIVSIGRLFRISAGGDAKPEFYSDTQDDAHPYPVYTNSMNKNQVYAYTSKPIYSENTITVTGRGAIGTAFYRDTPYDAIIRLLSLSPKLDLDGRFYAYWISNVIHFFTDSAAVGQLSSIQMSSYKTAYCSKEEQKEIAQYLDEKTAAIDSLIAKKNQLVTELESLKKSLIFEYVTGKKEVPT